MLIILINSQVIGQNLEIKDTIYINDESISEVIIYNSRDSLYTDLVNRKIYLWGNARVEMSGINMVAGYILIDLEKNEIMASYRLEKDSTKTELPIFTDGTEKIEAAKIRYNLNSKRGFIEETKIKQEETYLHMETAKKQANDEIHFIKGRYTTCDQEEPHYHFQLSIHIHTNLNIFDTILVFFPEYILLVVLNFPNQSFHWINTLLYPLCNIPIYL